MSLDKVPSVCHVSFKHVCAQNEDTGPELSIVMDRAQSRGSLKSRQAKIMVHQRTLTEASCLGRKMILGLLRCPELLLLDACRMREQGRNWQS